MFALRKLQTAAMLVLCAGAALAFDGGDVFDARELVLRDSAVAKAVGAIEYSDGLPIIAIDESYDRGLAEVRARVAQRYFEQHGDSLDYLIVFTDFDFETGPWAAFATRVKNDVDGVGLPIFDASAQFGSTSGRLQTYIDMAMLDRWEFRHGSQRYNQLLDASVHELMHRWAAHPRLLVNGVPTNDLLGQDGAHWSFWLDSDASLMYGARWAQQSDGRLVAAEVRRRLSNLDLYLAGLMDASEVGPIRLIRDGEGATATATPQLGFVTPGRFDTFAIDDVIGASGPRIPPATEAPRHFKAGLLLLRRPNQPTPPQGAMQLWRYARDLEMRFAALTHGRATLSIANPPKTTLAAAGLPTPLRGSPACPTCGFDGLRARSWLLSQQRQNGAWLDKPAMLPQATAAVLRNLHLLGTETTAAGTAARQFLSVFAARQFEDLRWKRGARVIPATVDAEMLAALDASHGIAGIDAWFAPTAWDLASELDAAFGTDTLAAALPRVLPQLRTLQNADGSFGATPDGRGHLGATAYVLSRLAPVDDTLAETIRAEAIGWLMPQIQGNGQLPGDDHGLITAWLLIGLQDRVTDLAPSLAFLRSHQGEQGDYSGSALTTIEALRALANDARANLGVDAAGLLIEPEQPMSGDVVRMRARVINRGATTSAATTAVWTASQAGGGTVQIDQPSVVPALQPGQSAMLERNWSTIGVEGARTLRLTIDPLQQVDETDETDNLASRTVELNAAGIGPDAALDAGAFQISPAIVTGFPVEIVVQGHVRNAGSVAVQQLPVLVQSSRGGVRSERARQLVDIAPHAEVPITFTVELVREDDAVLWLVADPDNALAEIRETNNELRIDVPVDVGPDLEVLSPDLVMLTPDAVVGADVQVRATLRNRGTAASGPGRLEARVDFGSTAFTLTPVPLDLAAGVETTRTLVFPALRAGSATLHVDLVAAGGSSDVNPANNAAELTFDVRSTDLPNLRVVAGSILTDPGQLDQGHGGAVVARILNSGAASLMPIQVEARIGRTLSTSRLLGSATLPDGLAAGADAEVRVPFADLDESGSQALFVSVDPLAVIAELDEEDNHALLNVLVRSLPDLAVTTASIRLTPSQPLAGQTVRADLDIRNLGAQQADLVEVKLLSGTPETGVAVAEVGTIPSVVGFGVATTTIQWTFDEAQRELPLTLLVDPEDRIRESRDNNNIAIRHLSALSANFASEPYFSPNGDGIRDTTRVHFSGDLAAVAALHVRNRGARLTRSFAPSEFATGNGIEVEWDGRDGDGVVVHDGDYRIDALDENDIVLAQIVVTVDTDRLPYVEAVGSPFELRTRVDARQIVAPARESPAPTPLLLVDPLDPLDASGQTRLLGLYRFDPLLASYDLAVATEWLQAHGGLREMPAPIVTRDGRWVVFATGAGLWRTSTSAFASPVALGELPGTSGQPQLISVSPDLVISVRVSPECDSLDPVLIDLRNGAQRVLVEAASRCRVLRLLEDGLLVGSYDSTQGGNWSRPDSPLIGDADLENFQFREAAIVPFAEGASSRVLLDAQEQGYIAAMSESGALVHLLGGGRERVEFRPFDGAAPVSAIDRPGGSLQRIELWANNLLHRAVAVDHERREGVLIDLANGSSRAFRAEASARRGPYADHFEWECTADNTYRAYGDLVSTDAWGPGGPCSEGTTHDAPYMSGLKRNLQIGATADRLLVGFTEQLVTDNPAGWEDWNGRGLGVRDYLLVDVADMRTTAFGGTTHWPLTLAEDIEHFGMADIAARARAVDRRFGASMGWVDGSGIDHDGRLYADYDIPLALDPDPVAPHDPHWGNAQRFLVERSETAPTREVRSSLLNSLAALRVRTRDGGFAISGVAMDRNLDSYELEWTRADLGGAWQTAGGSVSERALGELMFWAPPQPGDYRLRLSVRDRAGNIAHAETRAIAVAGADIGNVEMGPTHVSPNGDGIKDWVAFAYDVLRPTEVALRVHDRHGTLVYEALSTHTDLARVSGQWDGRDQAGARAADGKYRVSLGPWFSRDVVVDTTPPLLELEPVRGNRGPDGSSNSGDQLLQIGDWVSRDVFYNAHDPHLSEWRLGIAAPSGQVATVATGVSEILPEGRWPYRQLPSEPGRVELSAEDLAGNTSVAELAPLALGEVRATALRIVSAPRSLTELAWGCGSATGGDTSCLYSYNPFRVPRAPEWQPSGAPAYVPEHYAMVDLWVAPDVIVDAVYAKIQRPGTDTWADATVVAVASDAAGWRITVDPTLMGAVEGFKLQLFVRHPSGADLRSEIIEIGDPAGEITRLDLIDPEEASDCASALDLASVGVLGAGEAIVCAQEDFLGVDYRPELRINFADGSVSLGTLALVRDGLWLFRVDARGCSLLWLTARDRSGRTHALGANCRGVPGPLIDVAPDEQACGAGPAAGLNVTVAGPWLDYGMAWSRFELDAVLSSGVVVPLARPVLTEQQTATCAVPDGCPMGRIFGGLIDTSALPEGRHRIRALIHFADGSRRWNTAPLIVDRTRPLLSVHAPQPSARVCLDVINLRTEPPWRVQGEIGFQADTSTGLAYRQGIRRADQAPRETRWHQLAVDSNEFGFGPYQVRFPEDRGSDFYRARLSESSHHVEGELGLYDDEIPGREWFDGALILDVTAMGWSGAKVCRSVEFEGDTKVDAELVSSQSAFQLDDGRTHVIDPTGEEPYREIGFNFRLAESVSFEVRLWRLGAEPQLVTRFDAGAEPAFGWRWNGRLADGSVAHSGDVVLRFSLTDGCGHQLELKSEPFLIDSDPPVIEVAAPAAAATMDGMIVPIRYSVFDRTPGEIRVEALLDQGIGLATTPFPQRSQEQYRIDWNRRDHSGPALLRFTARDALGRVSVAEVPITLSQRPWILVAEASVMPLLFSPNGDGRLDATALHYALTEAATVSLRLRSEDGALLATLMNAEPRPAGSYQFDWNGSAAPPDDGVYLLELEATSLSDLSRSELAPLVVEIDRTAAVLELLHPTGEWSNGQGMLQLIVDEPHPALTRWIVGSASGQTNAVGVHELLELEALEEATHTLEVTSDDAVGNHRAFAHTFTVDRTAPLAEILRPASDEILGAQSDFSIIGSASDSHFASATVTLRAAGGDPQTLAAIAQPVDAATLAVLPTVLADGEYLINLSVADLAGNVASAERTIVVDKTPPTLVVEAPVDGANAGSRLVVRGSVYDEHLRDYRLRIATRAMAELEQFTDMAVAEAAVDSGVLFDLPFDLADGEYVIELVAFDLAGQQSSLRRRLLHDRVPPPAPDPLTAELVGNDVLLNWGASIAADLAGYRVYRDGSERSTVAATRLQWTDAAVPEGRLRYHVVAFDAAGNESAPSVPAIVTVDRTPPVVSIGAPRSDETVSGVVVVSGSVRSNEDLSGYRVHAEGPLPSTTRTLLASSDRDVVAGELARWDTSSFAEAQSYRIVLEAEDRIGNAATASVEVTIDQTAPAAPTGLAVSASGSDALLTWNANSESDLLGYVLLRGGNPVNGSGGFPPDLRVLAIAEPHWSDPRLPDGRHEWRVHAIDHAGNLSPGSDPVDWTFANRAPVIRIVAPANATEFADALAIVAESDDGDVVEVRFSQRAAAAATWTAIGVPLAAAPFRTSWDTAGLPYGEYVIRADARDAQGLDALPAQIVVHKVDREPPDQVQQLAARAHGGDVDLTWQAVANGDLHHYRIERHACTACDEWVAVADVPAGSEHHIDPARADGSQEYRVVAVDAFANDAPPSLSARAVVFTIELTPPFTPTRQAGVDLLLRSPRDGESAGQQITPDSSLSLPNLGVSANQPMRYAAIPLFLGANRFEIEVVDADGNRSRKAIASVVRGDAPAPPQGLALAVADHDVTATWLANAEANVVGYRLWHRDQALPAEAVVDGITTTAASGQHGEHASDGNASTGWLRGHTFEPDDEIESFVLDVALVERRWLSGISLSWADGNAPARYRIEAVYDHGVATLATISSPDQPHHAAAFAAPPYVQRLRVVLEALTGPQQYLSLAELVVHQSPLLPLPTRVLNVMDGTHPFHVTAVNDLGFESAPSDVATIAVGDTVAPDPVVLSAVASGAQAQLSWTPSPAPDVARYRIVRDGEVRDEVDASITEYSDGPRPNGVDRYRVLAIDVVGNVGAPSNEVELSFTELLPVAPEDLVVVAVDDRGVMQIVWRAGIGGATPVAYDVERADAVDGPWGAIGSASDTEYEDGDVELGRTYWYRVVALDAAGNRSVPSATASGRLEGVPVPMIFAPALGESAIEIRGERIVAAGTAWPGSTVSVRNHGVFAGEARTAGGDQRRSLVHSIAPGTLRAAPGGSWVDVAATAVAVPLPEAEGVPVGASAPVDLSAYGTIVGWTHDDLVVLLAPDGRTLDVRQLPSQQQRAALPLPFATEAVVVDAKLEYAIARPSGAADRLLRLDDSSGWSSALPGGRVDLASVTFEETLGVVGFRSEDGRLWRVDLGSNTTRQLDSGMGATRLAIQPRDGRMLWVRSAGTSPRVVVGDGEAAPVELGDGLAAAWLQGGEHIALLRLDGDIDLYAADSLAWIRRIASGVAAANDLVAPRSGRALVCSSVPECALLDLAGSWRVPALAMAEGENILTAVAVMPAGALSHSSSPVYVHRVEDAHNGPDLSTSLRVLPAGGAPGTAFAALATVRNLGDRTAAASLLRWSLRAPDGSLRELSDAQVPSLSVETAATVGVDLGVLAQTGAYVLSVEADADHALPERDETNNGATQSVIVNAVGLPLLELALDRSAFAPDTDVTGTARIINAGSRFSGSLRLHVLDAGNSRIVDLGSVAIPALEFGAELVVPVRWVGGTSIAASYRIGAELVDQYAATIASRTATFDVLAVRDFALALAATPAVAAVDAAVSLRAHLHYRAGNAAVRNAVLTWRVFDGAGNNVHEHQQTLATLLPGYRMQATTSWRGSTPGIYDARVELREGTAWLAGASASVVIVEASPTLQLAGGISTNVTPWLAGRPATAGFAATNHGTVAIELSSLRLRLLDDAALQVLATSEVGGSVAAGQALSGSLDATALALPIGSYLAVLDAQVAGEATRRTLASRSVSVVDGDAPSVVWHAPDEGAWAMRPTDLALRITDQHGRVDRAEISIDGAGYRVIGERGDGRYGTSVAQLPDGPHSVLARATDAAGNQSPPLARSFQVDGTPPEIAITGVADGEVRTEPVTAMVTISDAHLASQATQIDGAAYVSGSPITTEGDHTLVASATDQAGNQAVRFVRFRIDRTPPSVIFVHPTHGTQTTNASIDVQIASEAGATIALSVGGYDASASADAEGLAWFSAVPLVIGANTLSAVATDGVGNQTAPVAIQVERLDNSGAQLAGSLAASAAQTPRGVPVQLNWQIVNASAQPAAGVAMRIAVVHVLTQNTLTTFADSIDVPGNGQLGNGVEVGTASAELGDYVATLAVDVSGTWVQLAQAVFAVVDAAPPEIDLLSPLPDVLISAALDIQAMVTDADGEVVAVAARIDGGDATALAADAQTPGLYAASGTLLDDGAHSLQLSAVDDAGNRAETASIGFVVDRTPPQLLVAGVVDGERRNAPVTAIIEVVDAHPASAAFLLDGQPYVSGTVIAAEGPHLLDLHAADAGGLSSSRTLAFEIDMTPPVIEVTAPPQDAVLAAAIVDVSGLSEAGAQIELELAGASASVQADALGLYVVPQVALVPGDNVLRLRATDALGNASDWVTHRLVHAPNAGAALSGAVQVAPASIPHGDPVNVVYQLSNDGSGAVAALPVELRMVRLSDGQTTQTHAFALDLPAAAASDGGFAFASAGTLPGPHRIDLAAYLPDAQGVAHWQTLASAAFEVRDVLAPDLSLIAPAADAVVDTGFVVEVEASDLHGNVDMVQARLGDGAWVALAATAVPHRYAGPMAATVEGPSSLTVRASDDAGNAASNGPRALLVDLHPPQLSIAGVADGGLYAGDVLPDIVVVDVSPVSIVAILDGQPFVDQTPVVAEGGHLLAVTATDALGRSSNAVVAFTIDRTPPTTQIDFPSDGAVIAAASTTVIGVSEALARVTLGVNTYSASTFADGNGVFRFDGVPLASGNNRIAAAAVDRAGNAGPEHAIHVERRGTTLKDVNGEILQDASEWENGVLLPVGARVQNAGLDALTALPLTLTVIDQALNQTVAIAVANVDIASGGNVLHSFEFATHAWGVGPHLLRLTTVVPGFDQPRLLDTHLLMLRDLGAPTLAILAPAANSHVPAGSAIRVHSEDRLSTVAAVEFRIDQGGWSALQAAGPGGEWAGSLPVLSIGPHLLSARARDSAGNQSAPVSVTFLLAGTLPLALETPSDGAHLPVGPVRFAGTTAAHAVVTVRHGAGQWQATADGDGRFVIEQVGLAAGEQHFSVDAADAFDNHSATIEVRLTGALGPVTTPVPVPIPAWLGGLLLLGIFALTARERRLRQGDH